MPIKQKKITANAARSEAENVPDIQSLIARARDLSQSVDWWNAAMLWTLGFAALAAVLVVITTRMAILRAGQLTEVQDKIIELKEADASLQIAATQKAAGDANQRAAETNERAALLELESLELRKRLLLQGARENLVTGENRRHLVEALRPFAGQKVDVRRSAFPFMVNGKIVSVTPIGDDTTGLAEALLGVVKDAGWLSPPTVLPWGIQETGISVEITDAASPSTRAAADALVKALRSISLVTSGPKILSLNSNRFVRVGTVEQATSPVLEKDTIVLGILTHPK